MRLPLFELSTVIHISFLLSYCGHCTFDLFPAYLLLEERFRNNTHSYSDCRTQCSKTLTLSLQAKKVALENRLLLVNEARQVPTRTSLVNLINI